MLAIGALVGIAAVFAVNGDDGDNTGTTAIVSSTTTTRSSGDGKYSAQAISNACDLIDATAPTKWDVTPHAAPKHTSNRFSDASIQFDCSVAYEGPNYNSASLRLDLTVYPSADSAKKGYERLRNVSGLPTRQVSGIGEQASSAAGPYGSAIDVVDGNVYYSVQVTSNVIGVSASEVKQVAEQQARQVLYALGR